MAVEPISSVMTFQAQGSVVQKPQAPAEAEKPENSSDRTTAAVEYVDRTTSVVENAREKGQSNNGEQGQDQQVRVVDGLPLLHGTPSFIRAYLAARCISGLYIVILGMSRKRKRGSEESPEPLADCQKTGNSR